MQISKIGFEIKLDGTAKREQNNHVHKQMFPIGMYKSMGDQTVIFFAMIYFTCIEL
jgi:hypothetical protein